jgi:acylphosphatase
VAVKEAHLHAFIHGQVQGVSYRAYILSVARRYSLVGWVRNLPDGRTVEIRAEGSEPALKQFEDAIKKGPTGARVEKVDCQWQNNSGLFNRFEIRL